MAKRNKRENEKTSLRLVI